MKGIIEVALDGAPVTLTYKFWGAENDWTLTAGRHRGSRVEMCAGSLDVFGRVYHDEIDAAIRRDLMEQKAA